MLEWRIVMEATVSNTPARVPWNKDKLTGQKSPLKLKEIWAIRIRLQLVAQTRDLAMFNLEIDSKLRACNLTKLRVRDVCLGSRVATWATVMQQKTHQPAQFETTEQSRESPTGSVSWRSSRQILRYLGTFLDDPRTVPAS